MKTSRRLMNRQRAYKVSYHFKNSFSDGFGDITLLLSNATLNDTSMRDIRNYISDRNHGANIVILNIFPMGG